FAGQGPAPRSRALPCPVKTVPALVPAMNPWYSYAIDSFAIPRGSMSLKGYLLLVTLLCSAAALAQEFRGTILGRISDSSGAIIAGASVRVRNVDTNASASTNS